MSDGLRRFFGSAFRMGTAVADDWLARARQWMLADAADLDPRCRVYRSASVHAMSGDPRAIRVGADTHVRGELLVLAHGGRIQIGEWCYVGEGSRLWSAAEIVIEDRVLVAHGCEIHDWNGHPVDARQRHEHFRQIVTGGHPAVADSIGASPIRIREDAWIGFGSTILKGVTIGARSIVGSCSVVTEDVPDDTLVVGAPARPVRRLSGNE